MAPIITSKLKSCSSLFPWPGGNCVISKILLLLITNSTNTIKQSAIKIVFAMSIIFNCALVSASAQAETTQENIDRLMQQKAILIEEYKLQYARFRNQVHSINGQRDQRLNVALGALERSVGQLIYKVEMAANPQAFVRAWIGSVSIVGRGLWTIAQDNRQLRQIRILNQQFAEYTEQMTARVREIDRAAAQATAGPEPSKWGLAMTQQNGSQSLMNNSCDIEVDEGYGILQIVESLKEGATEVIGVDADNYRTEGRLQYIYINPFGERILNDIHLSLYDETTIIARWYANGQEAMQLAYVRCQ